MEELKQTTQQAIDSIQSLRQERDAALAQLSAITRQRDALREALEAVEWLPGPAGAFCPSCFNYKPGTSNGIRPEGHRGGCRLDNALALVRGE